MWGQVKTEIYMPADWASGFHTIFSALTVHIYYSNLLRFLYSPCRKHFDCSLQIEPVQLILWFQIPQSNMGQLIQSTHGNKTDQKYI